MVDDHTLLVRADAGGCLGTGHVMRMMALAQALQDRGCDPLLVSASCPEGVVGRLHEGGIPHRSLEPCEPGDESDLQQTLALAKEISCRWTVLDGYHFGGSYQEYLRVAGFKVLCVDDYGHCDVWPCNAILNQNLGAENVQKTGSVEHFRPLLGARFALLRREFYRRSWLREAAACTPLRRVLVTLGGVDPHDATGAVLDLLEGVESEPLDVRILVGAGNPNLEALRVRPSRHKVAILVNVSDMPGQYEWADGVISAGGSTCWEWLFYGLPACVVTIAENQLEVVSELVIRGHAHALGWFDQLDAARLVPILEQWIGRGAAGDPREEPGPVDGWGGHRVAAFLDDCPITIRQARSSDLMTYFNWANDPAVRANSFRTDPIALEDHESWFANRLASPLAVLLVAETIDEWPIGQVRLERRQDGAWLLDYSIGSEQRGGGLGPIILAEALRHARVTCLSDPLEIVAQVKPGNAASLKSLELAGFRHRDSSDSEAIELAYRGASATQSS